MPFPPSSSLTFRTAMPLPSSHQHRQPVHVALLCCQRTLVDMAKTGKCLSAVPLADACGVRLENKTLLGCSRSSQPPTILMLQVLCALVAHDDSKQRWLQSAGVLQLLERLLQSNSAGPEASDELSLYLVSLLLSHRGSAEASMGSIQMSSVLAAP